MLVTWKVLGVNMLSGMISKKPFVLHEGLFAWYRCKQEGVFNLFLAYNRLGNFTIDAYTFSTGALLPCSSPSLPAVRRILW